jgi:hypothetical protein
MLRIGQYLHTVHYSATHARIGGYARECKNPEHPKRSFWMMKESVGTRTTLRTSLSLLKGIVEFTARQKLHCCVVIFPQYSTEMECALSLHG